MTYSIGTIRKFKIDEDTESEGRIFYKDKEYPAHYEYFGTRPDGSDVVAVKFYAEEGRYFKLSTGLFEQMIAAWDMEEVTMKEYMKIYEVDGNRKNCIVEAYDEKEASVKPDEIIMSNSGGTLDIYLIGVYDYKNNKKGKINYLEKIVEDGNKWIESMKGREG